LLTLSKTIEKRLWHDDNPLRQFTTLGPEILNKLEGKKATIHILKDMRPDDIGELRLRYTKDDALFVNVTVRFPISERSVEIDWLVKQSKV
jgi:hypothetical protein